MGECLALPPRCRQQLARASQSGPAPGRPACERGFCQRLAVRPLESAAINAPKIRTRRPGAAGWNGGPAASLSFTLAFISDILEQSCNDRPFAAAALSCDVQPNGNLGIKSAVRFEKSLLLSVDLESVVPPWMRPHPSLILESPKAFPSVAFGPTSRVSEVRRPVSRRGAGRVAYGRARGQPGHPGGSQPGRGQAGGVRTRSRRPGCSGAVASGWCVLVVNLPRTHPSRPHLRLEWPSVPVGASQGGGEERAPPEPASAAAQGLRTGIWTLLIRELVVRQPLGTGSGLETPDVILMGCSAEQTRVLCVGLAFPV